MKATIPTSQRVMGERSIRISSETSRTMVVKQIAFVFGLRPLAFGFCLRLRSSRMFIDAAFIARITLQRSVTDGVAPLWGAKSDRALRNYKHWAPPEPKTKSKDQRPKTKN